MVFPYCRILRLVSLIVLGVISTPTVQLSGAELQGVPREPQLKSVRGTLDQSGILQPPNRPIPQQVLAPVPNPGKSREQTSKAFDINLDVQPPNLENTDGLQVFPIAEFGEKATFKPVKAKPAIIPDVADFEPLLPSFDREIDQNVAAPDFTIAEAILEGAELENDQQWGEAMSVYEKALKHFADNVELQTRFRTARYHFELGRRCRDVSFQNMIKQKSLGEMLTLYADIFSRIQTNHVDSPDWETLFARGLDDLEIALANPDFLKLNQISADRRTIEQLCQKLRATASPWSFRDIIDMKNGVLHIAEISQNEIGLKPSAVIMEYVCGAAFSLDPHTAYLSLRQLNDVYSIIEGCFVGIGVELDRDDQSLIILKVHSNSPADNAGLKSGDRIIGVNGTSTAGLKLDIAADLLQGESGSVVLVKIKSPNGNQREVRIVRREVEVASVEDVHIIQDGLGYIRLSGFQTGTTREMKTALNSLMNQGMETLILDLRQNPGGLLPVAVEVADLFVDSGVIVRTRGRNSQSETLMRASASETYKVGLILLIDEESASASEIFAGAIRDHKRGVIIGKQSYGKGTVQIIYRLTGNDPSTPISGLKLTVERFYSPNGLPFCNVGVVPDIIARDETELSPNSERVVASKPNNLMGKIAKKAPLKRRIVSSSPTDPFISEAIAVASTQRP